MLDGYFSEAGRRILSDLVAVLGQGATGRDLPKNVYGNT